MRLGGCLIRHPLAEAKALHFCVCHTLSLFSRVMGDANDARAASQHGSGGLSDLNKLASGPKYSGARGDHRTWWFKAQSYLGTKDLGTLAKGERQEEAHEELLP